MNSRNFVNQLYLKMEVKKNLIMLLALQIREFVDISSSDSENKELLENKRRKVFKITNYVETIVPVLISREFKLISDSKKKNNFCFIHFLFSIFVLLNLVL